MTTIRAGLCSLCVHQRIVHGRRSSFVLCELSRTDARYPRYPRLPVLACDGFVRARARVAEGRPEPIPPAIEEDEHG